MHEDKNEKGYEKENKMGKEEYRKKEQRKLGDENESDRGSKKTSVKK